MTMEHMTLERDGAVFVLRLTDGENRFNDGSVADWNAALDEVEASDGPAALVTTGTGKFYSNGLDLDALMGKPDRQGDSFVPAVVHLFGRLLRLPMISVAAVNGHAFAAGMMMAAQLSGVDENALTRLRNVLVAAGLPVEPPPVGSESLQKAMRLDKKASAGSLKFVLLESLGKAFVTTDYDTSLLEKILRTADNES